MYSHSGLKPLEINSETNPNYGNLDDSLPTKKKERRVDLECQIRSTDNHYSEATVLQEIHR